MLRGLFARRAGRPATLPEDTGRVAALVRAALSPPPGTELTVSEIVCLDPACPGTETVVLVMVPGRRTVALKLPAAADAVTEPDVRSALVAAGLGGGG